ncbi:MAG: T9SS type A sorting domain-containing protein [Bacteroidota bacterium]
MNRFLLFLSLIASVALQAQHHKNVTAILYTDGQVVPNTTYDLHFTLLLNNPDHEFGDSLAIEFEEGMTPINSATNPFATTFYGQDPEEFNGVFGQVVSWGDNNNEANRGGIETMTTHKFMITVSVDDTVTVGKKVRIHVSGDKNPAVFGLVPRDYDDFIYLEIAPEKPNLSLNFFKPVTDYYYIPKTQLKDTLRLTAMVANTGGDVTGESYVEFKANPGAFVTSTQLPRPFAKDSVYAVKAGPVFRPKAGITYDFKVTAIVNEGDSDPLNNVDSCLFAVTDSVLSRAGNAPPTDLINLTGTGTLGTVYNLYYTDTISSVSVYLVDPQPGDSISVSLYTMVLAPDSLLATSQLLVFDSASGSGWYTVPFADTVVMPATSFFVGVNQLTPDRLNLGIDLFNYQPNTNFVKQEGSDVFEPVAPYGSLYEQTYYIRVNTGTPWNLDTTSSPGTGISEPGLQTGSFLYPNPVKEEIRVDQQFNGITYQIFDAKGARITKGTVANGVVPVVGLATGSYVLTVGKRTFKFVRD